MSDFKKTRSKLVNNDATAQLAADGTGDPESIVAKQRIVRAQLQEYGLLMLSDPKLPSLVTIVVGEPISGSWWGHAKGKEIFDLANNLDDDADIVTAKLVSGKVTFVHRKLFSHLYAIGISEEDWQLDGLSHEAEKLLQVVNEEREVETHNLPEEILWKIGKPGRTCDELEKRLLVCAGEIHTENGAHAKRISSWEEWAVVRRVSTRETSATRSKAEFKNVLEKWNTEYSVRGKLPWEKK